MICNKSRLFREELRKATANIPLIERLLDDAGRMEAPPRKIDSTDMQCFTSMHASHAVGWNAPQARTSMAS